MKKKVWFYLFISLLGKGFFPCSAMNNPKDKRDKTVAFLGRVYKSLSDNTSSIVTGVSRFLGIADPNELSGGAIALVIYYLPSQEVVENVSPVCKSWRRAVIENHRFKIDLSGKKINKIPKFVLGLGCLVRLDISNTDITEIPKSFTQFFNLEELCVGESHLSCSDVIYANTSLRALDLTYNCLGESFDNATKLSNLEALNLSRNCIPRLFLVICSLESLRKLVLHECSLKKLPKRLSKLSQLEELILSLNDFEEFPIIICSLDNLRKLNLYKNKLTTLPDDLWKLSQLQDLDLRLNPFRRFPLILIYFKEIKRLCLDRNIQSILKEKEKQERFCQKFSWLSISRSED